METASVNEVILGEKGATLQTAHELFREYAKTVREHFGARVTQVWLYGSAARGDWTQESDIDVLVILTNEEDDDMEWLVGTSYQLGLAERHLLLRPVMLTTAEFQRLVASERRFATDILREGVAA